MGASCFGSDFNAENTTITLATRATQDTSNPHQERQAKTKHEIETLRAQRLLHSKFITAFAAGA